MDLILNKENERVLRKKVRKKTVMFVQKHHFNEVWSVMQCIMYPKCSKLIDETIDSNTMKHDKASFSFEVIKDGK